MNLDSIINRALAAEAARQQKLAEVAEAEVRERASQAAIFRDIIIPVIESARKQLTAHSIECRLTNGHHPGTGEVRHGLGLRWAGQQHTLLFQVTNGDIHPTMMISEKPYGTHFIGDADTATVEALTCEFIERALGAT